MITEDKLMCRIECGGYYGTVRYVGPVENHVGVWLGIDWDDPDRGKHDGAVDGVRYFNASHPTSGSFVRKEKVNFGHSIIQSIVSRYGSDHDLQTRRQNEQQLIKFQKDINAPFLEMVGFDKVAKKQKNFHALKIVNVRCQKVSSVGSPGELQSLCPNLRELDISKNLLSTWQDVFDVCLELKNLRWLNISENILVIPDSYTEYKFPNISTLICNRMNLTWQTVIDISTIFPNIRELRLAFNKIDNLTTPTDHNFKLLNYLDLEGNKIKHWTEVVKLSVIESLQHLMIEDVKLDSINIEEPNVFLNLRSLNISNNLIDKWSYVGELNKLPNLEHLRFKNNPVLQTENPATCHQIIVAKIKNLKFLNGTLIEREERRGAEYDYIKKYAKKWLAEKDTRNRKLFLKNHNRWLELLEEYGFPEESELEVKENTIKTTLVSLNFMFEGKLANKTVPVTLTIQKLIIFAQKLFKLKTRPTLKLFKTSEIIIDLDDEGKELGYYSVQSDDMVLVEI